MVIWLDYIHVHELLHCVHIEFTGQSVSYRLVVQLHGKVMHRDAQHLIHEGWVNFGFCRLEGPIFLLSDQRLVRSSWVMTPS